MSDTITIRQPDDWHVHFRDGAMLQSAVPFTARQFRRAIVMPNLVPPVTTVDAARAYRDRISVAVPDGIDFEPLMTAYLTDTIDAGELVRGAEEGVFSAVKLYPAGATTNSDSGVTDLKKVTGALECMQAVGLPLLLHGEVTDPEIDIFDREARFIEHKLIGLRANFPELKVVFEHVTTKDAVDYVLSQDSIWVAPSPRTIWLSTERIYSKAASVRTSIACPSPSARCIVRRFEPPLHPGISAFSLGLIPRRTPCTQRNRIAVVRAYFLRQRPWRFILRSLMKKVPSTSWRPLHQPMGLDSMVLQSTKGR